MVTLMKATLSATGTRKRSFHSGLMDVFTMDDRALEHMPCKSANRRVSASAFVLPFVLWQYWL